jgi:hypothetical protein
MDIKGYQYSNEFLWFWRSKVISARKSLHWEDYYAEERWHSISNKITIQNKTM